MALKEFTSCDYCHELPDGSEQFVSFGENGTNLLLHPACQQRMLDRYSALGVPVTDINGDRIDMSLVYPSERSQREPLA
jgi:hypothetical protein